MKRICIYCASSPKVDKSYFQAVEKLATILVSHDIEVVYGGGAIGLMGQLADTIIEKQGKIIGVMPHFMNDIEWAHKGVSQFIFTKTMAERKERLIENIDGLIALPGGSGTLEELFEVISLKRLGLFTKPIVILNTNDYYAPLKMMLERCVEENFMAEKHKDIWTFVDEPDEVMDALKNAAEWDENAIHFATVR
jgi:uncharacterized protein (TIGR00730 family)